MMYPYSVSEFVLHAQISILSPTLRKNLLSVHFFEIYLTTFYPLKSSFSAEYDSRTTVRDEKTWISEEVFVTYSSRMKTTQKKKKTGCSELWPRQEICVPYLAIDDFIARFSSISYNN
jgi:hypothetical protein